MDSNVEAVRDKLAARAEVGLRKYGVTTERSDLTARDRHPPPCGMENMPMPYTRLVERVDFSPESIHDTPARNWRERRQKARVIAASYRPRKPKPVWDEAF